MKDPSLLAQVHNENFTQKKIYVCLVFDDLGPGAPSFRKRFRQKKVYLHRSVRLRSYLDAWSRYIVACV